MDAHRSITEMSSSSVMVMAACTTDRSKRNGISSSPSSSSSSETSIEDLTDDLLIEIVHRLPSRDFAVQCKLVSKRWSSVISNPYFVCRFVSKFKHQYDFTMMMISESKINTGKEEFFLSSPESPTLFKRISLSFLPCFRPGENIPLRVVASYNDFLLCCSSDVTVRYSTVYFICNPFTRQWLALPPAPAPMRLIYSRFGFICDFRYKFTVVCVPEPSKFSNYPPDKVEIFSSDKGEWSTSIVAYPKGIRSGLFCSRAVAYNGVLHWLWRERGIVWFNINSSGAVDSCHFIPQPAVGGTEMIGVSQGCLRMSKLEIVGDCNFRLTVWELKDYDKGEWSLVDKISFRKFRWRGCKSTVKVSGFHPNDGDIVYFGLGRQVLSYSMRRRKFELASDLYASLLGHFDCFFPLMIPKWPIPVPTLPEIE